MGTLYNDPNNSKNISMTVDWISQLYGASYLGVARTGVPSSFLNRAIYDNQNISKKRSRGIQDFGPNAKRLQLSALGRSDAIAQLMAARPRRGRRGRRGKRRFRKRTFRKRKSFARRVKRVIFRTLERQEKLIALAAQTFAEGDGIARVTYIHSPLGEMFQGTTEQTFKGDQFYLQGLLIRGMLTMDLTTPPASSALVRLSLVKSVEQGAGFGASFVALTGTTTAITGPVQVPPNVNPRLFQDQAAAQFNGAGYVIPFDITRLKVIRSYMLVVNPSGTTIGTEAALPTCFKCYVPIKKMMQIEDATQAPITASPTRYKWGTYYWVLQVLASTAGSSADTVVNMAYESKVYFRDP